MAKVYVKFNSAVIKEIELSKSETSFGRKPGNDIVIDHATVSGFHGKIIKEGDRYFVEDLNSTNGTFIGGHRVKKSSLKNKDQIVVASHIIEFVGDDQPAAVATTTPSAPTADPELEKKKEMLRNSLGIAPAGTPAPAAVPPLPAASAALLKSSDSDEKPKYGVIRIVSGSVNGQTEIQLKDLNTYIGTSDQAAIKIKGFMVPSLAAAISRRPEGYFLKAVKENYPKVNGAPVKEQIFLENGALIEAGATNMVFYFSDAKNKESQA